MSPTREPPHAAEFRFYEELNDFLPAGKRKCSFAYAFSGRPAVKDAIEALGVPHIEVDLILVNGHSVGFDHRLSDGDRVAVYPLFERLDITPLVRLRAAPLRQTRFVLDVHLGKLAGLLRLLGFDSRYRNDYDDPQIITVAHAEGRIILTRDRGILKNRAVTHGYWVRSLRGEAQAREVLERFDLFSQVRPFRRCMACNGVLEAVEKEAVAGRLETLTRRHYHEFQACTDCGRVYWRGSHYQRLVEVVRRLTAQR
jgi:uncharacterized protein with PIN domain